MEKIELMFEKNPNGGYLLKQADINNKTVTSEFFYHMMNLKTQPKSEKTLTETKGD
jgi:hypothetical protein